MPNIESRIKTLSGQFAKAILAELHRATLGDIVGAGATTLPTVSTRAPTRTRSGRRRRRSTAELEADVAKVVAALKKSSLRAEQLQKATGLDRRALPRVIAMALAARRITKKGEKRGTTYMAK